MKTLFIAFFFGFILPLIVSVPTVTIPPVPVVIPTPTPTQIPTPTPILPLIYIEDVPFISQAPFGDWDDPRQQDGCEEAASLITVYWARNETLTPSVALKQIIAMAAYQTDNYGSYTDTSVTDTQARIIRGYLNFPDSKLIQINSIDDLIAPLIQGKLIIVPTDGRLLGNPNFTAGGPERHNLVVRGYDRIKREFITNDPGTRKGENYHYPENVLFKAIRDYPTGDHLPINSIIKKAILVNRQIR